MAAASAPARSCNGSDGSETRVRRAVAVLLVALLASIGGACVGGRDAFESASDNAVVANAEVVKIVDGDTMDVAAGDTELRVRMIGFDTPESVDPRRPVECFGKEASRRLAELAPVGTQVRLERDVEEHDRYGRTLAYVHRASDGLFLNVAMVADGYANVLSIPPNIEYADRFRTAEREARDADRGLWSACPLDPAAP